MARNKKSLIGKCGYSCHECGTDLEGEEFSRIDGARVCTECQENDHSFPGVDILLSREVSASA
jgi:hypothetical protein